VAFWAGVSKSRVPPTSSVGTLEFRTVVYWLSLGLAGQARSRAPPAQRNSLAGLPMIEPWSMVEAK
jgi:hypothetical protein